jgi:uncharacterized RDD family membrane protein YckC
MSTWYYSDAQRNRLGPVAAADLAQLHDNGQLAPEVLVWREGMPDWKPWREVMDEVLGRGPAASNRATFAVAGADAPPTASGNPYEVVERAAPPASPYAAPRATVGQSTDWHGGGEVVYAGFWTRAAATFIDGFAIGLVGVVVQMLLMGVFFGGVAAFGSDPSSMFSSGAGIVGIALVYLIPIAMQVVYYAAMHASASQATLGKLAVGIKVTDASGHRIGFWHGVGRYFATWLSALILCIGYVMAAFTDQKRALHDMVASTLVVDRWAFTAQPERQRRELGTVTIVVLALGGLLVVGYFVLIGVAIALAGMAG